MYKNVFILIVSLFVLNAFGQTPPFIKVGEKQFVNTDIYDIHYDDSTDVIYVSTNNGFYAYKQNRFIQLEAPKSAIGTSFFDIKNDLKGNLFCCNLGGQVFKVNGNKLELFYQLNRDYVGQKIHYFFNSKNQMMVIGVFAAYLLDEEGRQINNLISLHDPELTFNTSNACQTKDFSVTCVKTPTTIDGPISSRVFMDSGGFKDFIEPDFKDVFRSHGFLLFSMQNMVYWRDYEGAIFDFATGNYLLQATHRERITTLNDTLAIGLGEAAGGQMYELNNGQLHKGSFVFPDQFLSCAYMNKKGTLFLGTFGEGVYVIPKFNASLVNFEDELLLDLKTTHDNKVFISSRSGKFFKYQNETLSLELESRRNKDHLFLKDGEIYPDLAKLNPLDRRKSVLLNIKDLKFINESNFIFSNGGGVYMFSTRENSRLPSNLAHKKGGMSNFQGRFNAVEFDDEDSSLYFSSEQEVFKRNWNSFDFDTLKRTNESFHTNDLAYHAPHILCATSTDGVLLFDKGEYVSKIDMETGLKSNDVLQMKVKNDHLYILTTKGLQLYSFKTQRFFGLGFIDGLVEDNISKFDVSDDKLWLMSKHSFYPVELKEIYKRDQVQYLFLDSIIANGTRTPIDESTSFSHDENRFKFYFDYRDIETREEAQIAYTLFGFYNDWKYLPTTENELEFQSLPPGSYVFKIRAEYRGQNGPAYEYYFEILPPFWQRWWFYIVIIAAVAFIIIFYYRIRFKRQEKITFIENEMNTSKLTAIQSQMNPHFIFNALNSIQALVLKGDIDNSYTYINKFSSLVRKTLNYSDKEFIELHKEIKLIEIYLSLEKLRFREDFEYEIISNVNQEMLVPPMLIQPFIENSLVHGLIHKEGLKKIRLSFEFDKVLSCTIEDNGIGREASKKIKERQNPEHQSFAIDAIKNRLDILSERFENRIGFEYEDLSENGVASGTKVIIRIPTEYTEFFD